MVLPVVALVGRPNVGKSTLFNRLTRTRDALVADYPGLTRDRKYGQAQYAGHNYILIDTGGIEGKEQGIDEVMAHQSLAAIEEADIVLFLVDARSGVTAGDDMIAAHIRRQEKPVFLVVNKTDGVDADIATSDFYGLGLGNLFAIAAAQGRGVTQLLDNALKPLLTDWQSHLAESEDDDSKVAVDEEQQAELEADELANLPLKLAIIGRPNVGKSTLINRILGEERVVVYDMPGTTRDSVYIPMKRDEHEYILIDTAGVRRRGKINDKVEKFSVIQTLKAIEDANVCLLVIDARNGLSDQDLSLLGFILNAGRALVLAVNKWDGLEQDVKADIKRELDRRLGFIDFANVHFISALHGTGVGHLYESVEAAYASATKRISTSMLTRILEMAREDHQPPLVRGRRVKLRYAHAGGYNPPRIVIHGNQVNSLPDSYKRYLMNYYRKALEMVGTPIRIEFREGENPYANKTEKLTLSQQRARKRLAKQRKGKAND